MRRIPSLNVAALALAVAGCAAIDYPREGSTSDRVIHAYFSKNVPTWNTDVTCMPGPGGRGSICGSGRSASLPEPAREFDPARDEHVVFVLQFKPPREKSQTEMEIVGTLVAPNGGSVPFTHRMKANPEADAFYYYRRFSAKGMAQWPGVWTLGLQIDNEPVGTYTFMLGDAATIARMKESQKLAAQTAADLVLGPAVELEITGPPGSGVKIEQAGGAPKTATLDRTTGKLVIKLPPGTYNVEISKSGFDTWREAITLTAAESPVKKAVTLKPR